MFRFYPSNQRGVTETEWLHSRHFFSFGNYYHPERNNFGTLRVFNEDIVGPGKGFPPHPHDNMEIVTIVLEGSLEHRDTMGNRGILKAKDVQRMSAGSGVRHSEMNPSPSEKVHFLQLWIFPQQENIPPSYEQRSFSKDLLENRLCPLLSDGKTPETLTIHQNAHIHWGEWNKAARFSHSLSSRYHGLFLFVIQGEAQVGPHSLKTGDALGISETPTLDLSVTPSTSLLTIEVSLATL